MCSMAVESFAEWLSQQTDRDDQVGALAATVVGDPQFPEHGDRSIYEGYFSSAVLTLRSSWALICFFIWIFSW